MTNAITYISYQNDAIQNLCLASAPAYDSPFCSLAIRPITDPNDPNYTNPDFNFPTEIRNRRSTRRCRRRRATSSRSTTAGTWRGGAVLVPPPADLPAENTTINTRLPFPTWAVQPDLLQTTFLSYENERWAWPCRTNGWQSGSRDQRQCPQRQPAELRRPEPRRVQRAGRDRQQRFECWRQQRRGLPDREQRFGRTRSAVPVELGHSRPVLSDLGFHDDMGRFYTAGFRTKF